VYVTEINTVEKDGRWTSEAHVMNDDGTPLYGCMVVGATFGEVTAKIEAFLQGRVINANKQ
jgi:hypothetical protein